MSHHTPQHKTQDTTHHNTTPPLHHHTTQPTPTHTRHNTTHNTTQHTQHTEPKRDSIRENSPGLDTARTDRWLKKYLGWVPLDCFACLHDFSCFSRNRMADAFEQMIRKSDLQGLLQEANMIGCGMEQYYFETSDNEGEAMRALREKMASTIWSHEWVAKRTMFAYGPDMSTDPLEAQFLKTPSTMKQPRRILEIGMFTGYGAATMLKGCEYETLASLEIDPFLKPWVQECLVSMPNILSRHEIEVGPALDTLEKMPSSEAFDLVFIDANKSEYKRYVEVLIARGLLAENAMIVADNTLYCGIPFTPSEFVPISWRFLPSRRC